MLQKAKIGYVLKSWEERRLMIDRHQLHVKVKQLHFTFVVLCFMHMRQPFINAVALLYIIAMCPLTSETIFSCSETQKTNLKKSAILLNKKYNKL